MPLSEQEQRLLDEMERNLYHNDADYVATVGGGRTRPAAGAIALGAVLALIGLGGLISGVALRNPAIGVVGFVVMFLGVVLAVSPPRRLRVPARDSSWRAPHDGES